MPTGDYRDLLRKRLGPVHPALEPGQIVRSDGSVLGQHGGFAGFTVGQRRGLGGGFPEPMFVLAVRPETREVVVGTREELFGASVAVRELNWLTSGTLTGRRSHRSASVSGPSRVRDGRRRRGRLEARPGCRTARHHAGSVCRGLRWTTGARRRPDRLVLEAAGLCELLHGLAVLFRELVRHRDHNFDVLIADPPALLDSLRSNAELGAGLSTLRNGQNHPLS